MRQRRPAGSDATAAAAGRRGRGDRTARGRRASRLGPDRGDGHRCCRATAQLDGDRGARKPRTCRRACCSTSRAWPRRVRYRRPLDVNQADVDPRARRRQQPRAARHPRGRSISKRKAALHGRIGGVDGEELRVLFTRRGGQRPRASDGGRAGGPAPSTVPVAPAPDAVPDRGADPGRRPGSDAGGRTGAAPRLRRADAQRRRTAARDLASAVAASQSRRARAAAFHRPPGDARLPGRRPARRAAHLRRDQRPQHRDRPDHQRHASTSRCATCRGIRRSTSSSRPTSSATPSTARSSASRRWRVLAEEEEQRRKLADAQALAGELRVLTLPLSYAKAAELVPILTRSALSSRGEVQVDTRTNTLIVRDLPDRLTAATELISSARPAAAAGRDRSAHRADDARLRASARRRSGASTAACRPALGNTTGLAFPNSGSLTGRTGGIAGPRRRARPASTCGVPRHERARHRARRDQRRAQPRRRAVRARAIGPRPPALDAARLDAEQRRSRDDPGRADSDSDRRQQHRHGELQGRRADAQASRRRSPRRTP